MSISPRYGLPSSKATGVDESRPGRPDHHAHDDAEYSEEKEVEESSSTLYRAGSTGVNDQRLWLALSIGSVKEDLFGGKALALNLECQWFSE